MKSRFVAVVVPALLLVVTHALTPRREAQLRKKLSEDARQDVLSPGPKIAIGYINLPEHTTRSSCLTASIRQAGLGEYPLHKINGVRLGNLSSQWPNVPECKEAFAGLPASHLFRVTAGQAGLFCAQFNAAKQLSKSQADYYLILEDDVVFDEGFGSWMKRFVGWQEPWDVAMLNTYGYPKEADHAGDFEDAKLYRLKLGSTQGTYYGTHAYLLRKQSVPDWLNYLTSIEPAPFDHVFLDAKMRKPSSKMPIAYSVQKGIVEQAKMQKVAKDWCHPPYYTCHALSMPIRPTECCGGDGTESNLLMESTIPEH
mmetsp:Transcript_77020/g.121615  ORF Transcript_77020/g.121615 Transcript_77020/m.121615 type:complete len:312 (-) Transcript_77020:8-943(-)